MRWEEKQRLRKLFLSAAVILSLGIAYYLFVRFTGLAVPCVIHSLTGLYCSGCGITRMFLALFELDFAEAAKNNLFVLIALIPILAFTVEQGVKYVKGKSDKFSLIEKVFIAVFIILFFAFGIIRNLPPFSFLLPI